MTAARVGALLLPPGDSREDQIRRSLSLPNPKYVAWLRHGKGRQPVSKIDPCIWQDGGPWQSGMAIPRRSPVEVSHADRTVMGAAEVVVLGGDLRGYQEGAVTAALEGYGGLIKAPCGAGKSWIGKGLVAELDTPALVLVHTRDLLNQWKEHIGDMGCSVAQVGGGKRQEPARVTVAMLQSLARKSWWDIHCWAKDAGFGLVIADEVHHVAAETWSKVMLGLPARYRVGLTATDERTDGLTPWLHWHLGPKVYEVAPEVLEGGGQVLAPSIRWVAGSDCEGFDGLESHERNRALAEDDERNGRLAAEVAGCHADGRSVLVLVKLVDHAHRMAELLSEQGAVAVTGKLSKGARAEAIESARGGSLRVMVATSLADEGLDVPRFDTVVLAAPSGHIPKVTQRIGRVCRPHPDGQQPLVIDVADRWGPYQGYARRRRNLYAERGWA